MKLDLTVINTSSNIQRLSISGNIESGYITPLGKEFVKLIEGPAVKLILDVEGAEGISGSGIGELIKVRNDIIGRGGKVVLMGVNSRVVKMIDVSGLHNYFPIAKSVTHAIQLLDESASTPRS